jgi:hypothetical protein
LWDRAELCIFLANFHDTLLGPGAIVDYSVNSLPDAPVPLPVSAIFSTSCLVPGAQSDTLKAAAKAQSNVAVQWASPSSDSTH